MLTYRDIARSRIVGVVHESIGGSPWSSEFEAALEEFFEKFNAAVDSIDAVAEVLNEQVRGWPHELALL